MTLDPVALRPVGFRHSRKERMDALVRRKAYLETLLAAPGTPSGEVRSFFLEELEALTWAIPLLAALVECHNVKFLAQRAQREGASRGE